MKAVLPAAIAAAHDVDEAFARALFLCLPDPAWLKGPDGRYITCNRAFERVAGCDERSLRGRTDDELFEPADAAFFRLRDRLALASERPLRNEEWLSFTDTGERRLFEVVKTRVGTGDGGVLGVLGVARDVLERQQLAEALAERSCALDRRLREMRCLYEASTALGDFSLTPAQAAQVVVVCLSMVAAPAGGVRVGVRLGGEHAGDAPPPSGWARVEAVRIDDLAIGEIGWDLPADPPPGPGAAAREPAPDLLVVLARELARWFERRGAAERLRRSELHLREVQRVAGLGSWWGDPGQDRLHLSASACAMFGVPDGIELGFESCVALVAERDQPRLRRQWRAALQAGGLDIEFRLAAPVPERWLHAIAELTRDGDGRVTEVIGTVSDISARKREEAHLRLSARIFESAGESIIVTDARRRIVAANATAVRLSGYRHDELIGRTPSLLASGRQPAAFYAAMWRQLDERGSFQGEFINRARDGRLYPLLQTITALRGDDDEVTHYVAIGTDLSALREAEARTHYLRHHDTLTGLPNRSALDERLDPLVAAGERLALITVGIDGFKSVNESIGPQAGDAVLVEMAQRLRTLDAPGGRDRRCRSSGGSGATSSSCWCRRPAGNVPSSWCASLSCSWRSRRRCWATS